MRPCPRAPHAPSTQPYLLTSITDENGNTNAQWTYDGTDRVLTLQHTGGADLYTGII